jgi:signal transduction histidine kinase
VVVHEVRSPVAALAAIAKTFTDIDASAEAAPRELVALAVAACNAIQRLVLDASVTSLRREQVDLGEVAATVAAAARLGGARVDVSVERPLPTVEGDPIRLRQALSNLVSNALVHAVPASPVTIAVAGDSGRVRTSVSDVGPGIPATQLSRIFEAGVRLDASRSGSGLGLSIVEAIVTAHGGDLTVVSTPGEGTTFTFVLPAS